MQKELLSAYIDGEQVSNKLTEELCQDAELQRSWANYHLIGSILRQESNVLLGEDFSAKMEKLIAEEETKVVTSIISQPRPEEIVPVPLLQKLRHLFMPVTQVAVAAGVCFFAILGVQTLNLAHNDKDISDIPVLQTLPFNSSVQEVSYNVPSQEVVTSEQIEKKNKRIGAMLQNYELQKRIYSNELSLERDTK
ncbi:RseA-like anti sigma(E) protein [Bisgaardia hudsonensis]|uniref:Anti-sigma-E factor RseA n=1 Tax=Bisgaardia hudsonensis TaxID=109472 RepID=A0A4V2SJ05_9PAST|nr:sigma-E factor negative regulatory protein [Bisgaardia hudsonensis]QLB12235.1 transcriptional regulator [Bisgaardia hudsonensis]TCP12278.1 RseA-like anti sigma(E) protein [Bisgaardia hudsonensis]